METMYQRYQALQLDGRWIGLERSDDEGYFCTPLGAKIIGWEGCDGIHYCFVPAYGEEVFAVNPDSRADSLVYPLAANFTDFLRLILACNYAGTVEQIINWDSEQVLSDFMANEDNKVLPEQQAVLDAIRNKLGLSPMEHPFQYVKGIQAQFDPSKLIFSDEYYDITGFENPREPLDEEADESCLQPSEQAAEVTFYWEC